MLIDGLWLNKYVAPELLKEFKNYKDDFIGVLPGAPAGAVSADGIRFNKLVNNADFLVNNDDDFVAKKMLGKNGLVEWDKFDTTPTSVDDAEIRALSFDLRSVVRTKHGESWRIGIRDYVLQKLAPLQDASGMPVIRTTGEDDGTGRKRMTFADLIKFYGLVKVLNLIDKKKMNFILSAEHQQDLMYDRSGTNNYRDGFRFDASTGEIKGYYDLNIFENNASPIYSEAGTLKAKGAAPVNTDRNASTFFYSPNTVYHVDSVKIIYSPEHQDTKSADPTSEFRLQSYGLCDKTQDYGFGALVSGIV